MNNLASIRLFMVMKMMKHLMTNHSLTLVWLTRFRYLLSQIYMDGRVDGSINYQSKTRWLTQRGASIRLGLIHTIAAMRAALTITRTYCM
jgi:hypothetical protein